MEEIPWHETYVLGFPQLDRDHRRLLDLANAMIRALNEEDFAACGQKAEAFVEALRAHFPREEKFLAEIEYPQLDVHAGYHRRMLERAEDFLGLCERAAEGERAGFAERIEPLISALLSDVRGGDLNFRTHLLEKGLDKALIQERFGSIWL